MRLTKLKLAGFKSFVDPTSVSLPGQLVGVVGPNGCGKSNIMDAVRWVLGESKASELRGESMQDVIFNGSTKRAPVSRAQVELVFDNNLGRAAGQWSQYAELSVKRVLTRAGQSDYLINNLKVRRKDITDLFLGTGLGPRAYAIIGQGMISRIIEARPEDLRVFLEEAAGVTRYKERRRETEGRIEDTRENLVRLEDIRLELGSQMERLEVQAEVARRYNEYNSGLQRKQQILWLLRRNEALDEQRTLALAVQEAMTALEGQMAGLRETEAGLETARETHFSAGDRLHQAQGDLFAVNADVARLEAEIRHRHDSWQQLQDRLGQLKGEREHWQALADKQATDRARWEELQDMSAMRQEEAASRLDMQSSDLPEAEATLSTTQQLAAQARNAVVALEQKCQVELANKAHIQRARQALHQRRLRAQQERDALNTPDELLLEEQQEVLAQTQEALMMAEAEQEERQTALEDAESDRQIAQQSAQTAARELAKVQAHLSALERLQAKAPQTQGLQQWLTEQGVTDDRPLWRHLSVAAGWETAVEAVLRERLNALAIENLQLPVQRPPAGAVLYSLENSSTANNVQPNHLLAHVQTPLGLQPLIQTWMGDVYCVPSLEEALQRQPDLPAGQCLVTPDGDLVGREFIQYFVADPASQGFLARQREIESLQEAVEAASATLALAEGQLNDAEVALDELQTAIQQGRSLVADLNAQSHRLQVEVLKLEQAMARYYERVAECDRQLLVLEGEEEQEVEREMAADEALGQWQDELMAAQEKADEVRSALQTAEQAVRVAREQSGALEREVREAEFAQRECANKLQEIYANQAQAERQLGRIADEQTECESRLHIGPVETLEVELQAALDRRSDAENKLALCRDQLERATQQLRVLEEQRMKIEMGLEPLRQNINELKLREQAAALNAQQLSVQLLEAGAEEEALLDDLPNSRPATVAGDITRLQKAIAELGAVNLAALQELETARERKGYLDSQAEDLSLALETLENAIRRIDRETRDLLQNTFDEVNGHFGRLFPELFGGGRAELVMTGEEILDAGVQVVAQPPGKKNSTIHLLSGGEKALTAIALVFSMFQLNPAPFCLLDEVDAPLDDTNTERFCKMVKKMSDQTQFLFISHNKIAMEMAAQLVGVTMQESGVSRVVEVDIEEALRMSELA
ncbi:MAG: chromosome segregation protein [Pseudomonadota bacterium]